MTWRVMQQQEMSFMHGLSYGGIYMIAVYWIGMVLIGDFILPTMILAGNYALYTALFWRFNSRIKWLWFLLPLMPMRINTKDLDPTVSIKLIQFAKDKQFFYFFNMHRIYLSKQAAMKMKLMISESFVVERNKPWKII